MSLRHMLARLKQKLPHASLASYIGVDSRTLGRWLAGRNVPLPVFQSIIADLHTTVFNNLSKKREIKTK